MEKWFDEIGETYLTKKNLGNSLEEVFRHQNEFSQVEQQFAVSIIITSNIIVVVAIPMFIIAVPATEVEASVVVARLHCQ